MPATNHDTGLWSTTTTAPLLLSSSSSSSSFMIDRDPLPTSLDQVFDGTSCADRAVVMTEMHAPFRIVHVNTAWEGLCGYQLEECRDKTLGMLQGPDTNLSAATSLLHQLLQGEEAGTILTNYTKEGRRFRNYLRVAPLHSDPFFVGQLQEIQDGH